MKKTEIASGPALTDETVVRSVLQGQTNDFERLVRKYNERLYRIGISYLKDRSLVEDAMQQTYVKAFLNLKSFMGGSAFSTWITRIMINECLMALRQEKRISSRFLSLSKTSVPTIAHNTSVENKIIEEEMRTALEKAILKLPDNLRTIYMLRIVEQLSTEETAACLQISTQNVKVRLHRSRTALKENLFQMAEGVELFGFHLILCNAFTERVMDRVRSLSN